MTGTEATYRAGVAKWADGDLDAAADLLGQALAGSAGPDDDPWWFAASRAAAQVAMDQGRLDVAAQHLARTPHDLIGAAQSLVLRGRLAHLRGDDDDAALQISAAAQRVAFDSSSDIPALMNGAIALANAAEVLVELGFGDEALRLVGQGRDRVRRAGVDDPSIASTFAEVEANVAQIASPKSDPVPVERWVEVQGSRDLPSYSEENEVGYAVVVSLAVDGDPGRFDALDRAVCDLLDERPDLGEVDGTGTNGEIWELFVDGDDPDALWEAMRPLVEAVRPGPGSTVVLQHITGDVREIPLDRP